jgi:hypothetical protein
VRHMVASPEQLNAALMYCLDFASHMLENSASFLPFGAKLTEAGEVQAVGGWTGEEHPAPTELYALLAAALRSEAKTGTIAGSALAVDVNIPPEYNPVLPHGIRVHLEGEGYSRYIYTPYAIKAVGPLRRKREVVLTEPFSVKVPADVFVSE